MAGHRTLYVMLVLALLSLTACSSAQPEVTVLASTPSSAATATATIPPTAKPTALPSEPAPTTVPTPEEMAPAEAFIELGSAALLADGDEVKGRVLLAGLQTLIVREFYHDPTRCAADVRLVLGNRYDDPAAILCELGTESHTGQTLVLHVPASAKPGSADRIVIYCPETGEVLAEGVFQKP